MELEAAPGSTPIPSWLATLFTTALTTACAASGGNCASTDWDSPEDDEDSEREGVDEYILPETFSSFVGVSLLHFVLHP